MKTTLKLIIIFCLFGQFQTAEAQLLKRLKKRVENKIERKIEKTVDNEIDSVGKKKPEEQEQPKQEKQNKDNIESIGSTTLTHSKKYGTVKIDELRKLKVIRTNNDYNITGNWWSHEADIFDGFSLIIKTSKDLKQGNNNSKAQAHVFRIPEDASLKLGYDPQLLYKEKTDDNYRAAVSDDYQNFDILKGEVTLDVLTDGEIKISFSGQMKLREITRHSKDSEDYTTSFFESTLIGSVEGNSPQFIDNTSIKKTNTTENAGQYSVPESSSATGKPGVYSFTTEAVVKVTTSQNDQEFKMSYLLNPNTNYMGIKVDMGDYSEEETDGESIIIMDNGDAHIFVETAGMKIQMSSGQMGGKQSNPAEEMANYDYTKIKKTGQTKTILGAICYEYVMADKDVKMNLWVAPEVNLPNWFVQNKEVINGYIMEYTVVSKDGTSISETIAIKNNISKTINPKDYRKMF